jgi:hypothetical protein
MILSLAASPDDSPKCARRRVMPECSANGVRRTKLASGAIKNEGKPFQTKRKRLLSPPPLAGEGAPTSAGRESVWKKTDTFNCTSPDVGLPGYTGKREGVTGSLQIKLKF